ISTSSEQTAINSGTKSLDSLNSFHSSVKLGDTIYERGNVRASAWVDLLERLEESRKRIIIASDEPKSAFVNRTTKTRQLFHDRDNRLNVPKTLNNTG